MVTATSYSVSSNSAFAKNTVSRKLTSVIFSFLLLSTIFLTIPGITSPTNAIVTPLYLTLNKFSGHAGTVLVSGGGYSANETVDLFEGVSKITTVQTDNFGNFGPSGINIPLNAPQGSITIKGVAENKPEQASNSYYIVPFTPSIQIVTTSNTPYSNILVNGAGFGPNEGVVINLASASANATSDGSGNFTGAAITIPNVKSQTYTAQGIGQLSGSIATTYFYIGTFFPSSSPSAYYLLPEQILNFSGNGYANTEQIQVYEGLNTTPITSFVTDINGSFSLQGNILIPFSYAKSPRTFTLIGQKSNAQTKSTVTIGAYYPSIIPSAYSLFPGDILNFSGTGFAPNENINVYNLTNLGTSLSTFSSLLTGSFSNLGSILIPYTNTGTTQLFRLIGQSSNGYADTSVNIQKYYPTSSASTYYLLPGGSINFSGSGYIAGETITLTQGIDPTALSTFNSDSKGAFTNQGNYTIPYDIQSSSILLHLKSNKSLSDITFNIGIGKMNPLISPSSYYIKPGQTFSISGKGFAPGEDVKIQIGNTSAGDCVADPSGSIQCTSLIMPFGIVLKSILINATGQLSKATGSASVGIGVYTPSVGSSSYYIQPGNNILLNGAGFAPNESISVQNGNTTLLTVISDGYGGFIGQSLFIPYGLNGSLNLLFIGKSSNASAQLSITLSAFYPSVISDNYYTKPGTKVNITGKGFAPNEKVDISTGNNKLNTITDSFGNISSTPVTIPFGLVKTATIVVAGELSLASVSLNITLAPFYPQITPSTYYAKQGSSVTFSGSGFAPNETVGATMNSLPFPNINADSTGIILTGSVTLPFAAKSAHFEFMGNLSNSKTSVDIGLQGFYPGLSLDNYYSTGGIPLTLTGTGYLAGEIVSATFAGTFIGSAIADNSGHFTLPTNVPYQPAGSKVVIATGQTSLASAQTTFTEALVYVSVQLGVYAGKPGTNITFTGSGYLPDETIDITTDRTGNTVVQSFSADKNGSFNNSNYTIPLGFNEGNLNITITGEHSLNPKSIIFYVNHI